MIKNTFNAYTDCWVDLVDLLENNKIQKDTKFWSPIIGDVYFQYIDHSGDYPEIVITDFDNKEYRFDKTGGFKFNNNWIGHYLLNPSPFVLSWREWQYSGWTAPINGTYYYINAYGEIIEAIHSDSSDDLNLQTIGNYFRTKTIAKNSAIYKAFHNIIDEKEIEETESAKNLKFLNTLLDKICELKS